jgi:hypothetical protein
MNIFYSNNTTASKVERDKYVVVLELRRINDDNLVKTDAHSSSCTFKCDIVEISTPLNTRYPRSEYITGGKGVHTFDEHGYCKVSFSFKSGIESDSKLYELIAEPTDFGAIAVTPGQ